MPQLWEILGKKKPKATKKERKKAAFQKEVAPKPASKPVHPQPVIRHSVLSLDAAKKLFVDLPKKHRFWLKTGHDISNIMELFRELHDMDEETFSHHVKEGKNDFAAWVADVYGDHLLAGRLTRSYSRREHIRVLGEAIESMKTPLERASRRSHINPNLQFLRKSFDKPDRPLETRRRIRPAALRPDYSFIRKAKKDGIQLERKLAEADIQLSEVHKAINEASREISNDQPKPDRDQVISRLKELKAAETVLTDEMHQLARQEELLAERYGRLVRKEAKLNAIDRRSDPASSGIGAKLHQAKDLVRLKRYQDAKALIMELRQDLANANLPKEEKKKAYYSILELSTDIDIALLR